MAERFFKLGDLLINPDHIRLVKFRACPETARLLASVCLGDELVLDLDSDQTEALIRCLGKTIMNQMYTSDTDIDYVAYRQRGGTMSRQEWRELWRGKPVAKPTNYVMDQGT